MDEARVNQVVNQPRTLFSSEKFPRENRLSAIPTVTRWIATTARCGFTGQTFTRVQKKKKELVRKSYERRKNFPFPLLFASLHRETFLPGKQPSHGLEITRVNPWRKQLTNKRGARPLRRPIDASRPFSLRFVVCPFAVKMIDYEIRLSFSHRIWNR